MNAKEITNALKLAFGDENVIGVRIGKTTIQVITTKRLNLPAVIEKKPVIQIFGKTVIPAAQNAPMFIAPKEDERRESHGEAIEYEYSTISPVDRARFLMGNKWRDYQVSQTPTVKTASDPGFVEPTDERARYMMANKTKQDQKGVGTRTDRRNQEVNQMRSIDNTVESWEEWIDPAFREKKKPKYGGKDPRKA